VKHTEFDFEPWSPSLATEAISHEIYRAETRRIGASKACIERLRSGLSNAFESEAEYVMWCLKFYGTAPTPWRTDRQFFE
jgi:hypothetical protein